jgi:hypothetical protein
MHNKSKIKDTSSAYYGVSFWKNEKKWAAAVAKDGKRYYLGLFTDEKEAALAYNKKATELYGDFANLNVF